LTGKDVGETAAQWRKLLGGKQSHTHKPPQDGQPVKLDEMESLCAKLKTDSFLDKGKSEETAQLALDEELVKAPAAKRLALLESYRDGSGSIYTEALAKAIPRLQGTFGDQARIALAQRLKRMTVKTLREYLKSEDNESRHAAVVACGLRGEKSLTGEII